MNMSESKLARLKAGLRQIDIALRVGVSTSLISQYEAVLAHPSPGLSKELNRILGDAVYNENPQA